MQAAGSWKQGAPSLEPLEPLGEREGGPADTWILGPDLQPERFLLSQPPARWAAGQPSSECSPAGAALALGAPAALRLQQSASTVSGSPTMSLCTSLKVSMNSSIQSCRSSPVANLARSAV